jgi:hypothetical protein
VTVARENRQSLHGLHYLRTPLTANTSAVFILGEYSLCTSDYTHTPPTCMSCGAFNTTGPCLTPHGAIRHAKSSSHCFLLYVLGIMCLSHLHPRYTARNKHTLSLLHRADAVPKP